MEKLRLALVADVHHGEDYGTKLGASALPLLERFALWCRAENPAVVVDLGDRINNVSADQDARLTAEVAAAFRAFDRPVTHLLGNHDCHALTVEQSEYALGVPLRSHSTDRNGFHLVFWNARAEKAPPRGYAASDADLDWLARDLAATELRSVVFSHFPLDGGSMAGNLYFERGPSAGLGGYENAAAARAVIEASGKVVLCLAGHTHWNALSTIDGIHYATVPSLTEAFMSWPNAAAAWATCELDDNLRIRVEGEVPAEYRLPLRRPGQHWMSHHRDYAPKPPERVVPKGRHG
jgi:hypothetical protein